MSSLDIGCGYSRHHVKKGEIGVDLKRGLCDVLASAHYLPFKNNCFEKATLSHVLEHLTGCEEALKEAARVLTDKGTLQIETPNPHNFAIFKDILLKKRGFYQASREHIYAFGENELLNLLARLNFDLLSMKYVDSMGTRRKMRESTFLKKAAYNLIWSVFPPFKNAIRLECKPKPLKRGFR